MKVALITDLHFGVRGGKELFHAHFQKFYQTVFFPTLAARGVDTVIDLGDTFDNRKNIDFNSIKRAQEYFFDPARAAGLKIHMLVGNHDIYLRNSLAINSPELLLREYSNVFPIDSPAELRLGSTKFLMLPWICADNYIESMALLKDSDAQIVCGHLEISGFQMHAGQESHEGFETGVFSRFKQVFSGHYHHRSSKGNITYLGNPYEMTWSDYNDPRGFHIFDTETHELEFIENPHTLFTRVEYRDTKDFDFSILKDQFVKIVVHQKTDYYAYDQFLDRAINSGAHDVKVIENLADLVADELDDDVSVEDTQSILRHYVERAEVDVDREKLADYMSGLYVEALNTTND